MVISRSECEVAPRILESVKCLEFLFKTDEGLRETLFVIRRHDSPPTDLYAVIWITSLSSTTESCPSTRAFAPKPWPIQISIELHPIPRMQVVQFLQLCGVLRVEWELRSLVKELFESAGLAHKDQLASSCAFVGPTMRKIPRQPDASACRQMILLTARFEEELAGQDVVPLAAPLRGDAHAAEDRSVGAQLAQRWNKIRGCR